MRRLRCDCNARGNAFGDITHEPMRGVTLVTPLCRNMLRQHRRGVAAASAADGLREDTLLSAMQVVTLNGQVASGSIFDNVLFIQSIQGRLALRENANIK